MVDAFLQLFCQQSAMSSECVQGRQVGGHIAGDVQTRRTQSTRRGHASSVGIRSQIYEVRSVCHTRRVVGGGEADGDFAGSQGGAEKVLLASSVHSADIFVVGSGALDRLDVCSRDMVVIFCVDPNVLLGV